MTGRKQAWAAIAGDDASTGAIRAETALSRSMAPGSGATAAGSTGSGVSEEMAQT